PAGWRGRPDRTRHSRLRGRPARRPGRSLDARSQDDDRVEIELAADEPAAHVDALAAGDDGVETTTRRLRERDQHDVRPRLREYLRDLVEAAEHRHALHAPPPQLRIVVDEADDVLARSLAQLAQEAAAASARTDDERAPPRLPVLDRAERVVER